MPKKSRTGPKAPKPKVKPVGAELKESNAALRQKRVLRRCLGRGKEHYFLSCGPENRVCGNCRNRADQLHLSPRMTDPVPNPVGK